MSNILRTVPCDVCRGAMVYPTFCWKCFGSGRIELVEAPRPAHWSGKALGYYFLGVCVALGGAYGVARWLGWL